MLEYLTKTQEEEFLQKILENKTISILGDSISTYTNVSNGEMAATTNTTIENNANWYTTAHLSSWKETYWGRMIEKYGMRLCVNNSASGGWVIKDVDEHRIAGVKRCTELHVNTGEKTGTEPDIIVVYLGTNDLIKEVPVGNLTGNTYNQIKEADGTYIDPTTFAEGYAIIMDKIANRYPNADVFCFTLLPTSNDAQNRTVRCKYNEFIKEIAAHYGAFVVDLATESGFTNDNFKPYFCGSHPLSEGVERVSKVFEDALKRRYC